MYNSYGNPYNMNVYRNMPVTPTRQDNINAINDEITRLEQMKSQLATQQQTQQQQPTSINQTFQLAPTNQTTMKFANTIEDVAKEFVTYETPFFTRDMSVMWVKNNKNEIRTYELNEIIPKSDKDIELEYLRARVEELEKEKEHEQYVANVVSTKDETITTGDDEPIEPKVENVKPSSVSRVSKSKK